jgi:hypothetical protein
MTLEALLAKARAPAGGSAKRKKGTGKGAKG